MTKYVIYSVGKDQPGIVAAFTKLLFEFDCNIEDSSMTILYDQFAMILIITPPLNLDFNKFYSAISKIERELNLITSIKPLETGTSYCNHQSDECKTYMVRVCGSDKSGIAYHITDVLSKNLVNITDFNSRLISKKDPPVYLMMIETQVSSKVNVVKLEEDLKSIAQKINVDLTFEEIDVCRL